MESKLQLFFLGLLSFSFVAYLALRKFGVGLIFGHTAAVSIMGFFGCLTGAIAKMKGYSYWRAFQIGFFLPMVLGGIAAFLFVPEGGRLPLTCGGWVSLGTGIVVVLSISFFKKRVARLKVRI